MMDYDYDYEKMKTRCNIYKEQVIKNNTPFKNSKIFRYGISIDELDNHLYVFSFKMCKTTRYYNIFIVCKFIFIFLNVNLQLNIII